MTYEEFVEAFNELVDKPCRDLAYCPYGVLVEELPLAKGNHPDQECSVFGHVCPVFICAEPVIDFGEDEEV